jgi:ABC-type uncharacterized transport system permease subunit
MTTTPLFYFILLFLKMTQTVFRLNAVIVGSEVLTAVVMKNYIFWDITGSVCYLLHVGFLPGLGFEPKDGGDMFLRNVG